MLEKKKIFSILAIVLLVAVAFIGISSVGGDKTGSATEATLEDAPHIVRQALRQWRHITQHKRSQAALRKARKDLEKRIEERTVELATANMRLQEQIAECKAVEEALQRQNQLIVNIAKLKAKEKYLPRVWLFSFITRPVVCAGERTGSGQRCWIS